MSPNKAVVSSEAKENTRLRIRESEEMRGSVMNALNSGGKGGKGGMAVYREPPGPQQNPASSPVSNLMPHVTHLCSRPPLRAPHVSVGEDIGPIAQVLPHTAAISGRDEPCTMTETARKEPIKSVPGRVRRRECRRKFYL